MTLHCTRRRSSIRHKVDTIAVVYVLSGIAQAHKSSTYMNIYNTSALYAMIKLLSLVSQKAHSLFQDKLDIKTNVQKVNIQPLLR